jgi:predicted dehydrogenase
MKRKTFLRQTALATAALGTLSAQAKPLGSPAAQAVRAATDPLRLALVGTGLRGQNHLELLLRRNDVVVTAICDIDARMLADAKALVDKSGKAQPKVYTGNPQVWKDLLAKEKLDGIFIATPWEWHAPMVLGALQSGIKYIATEVVLGISLEDHWKVVREAEKQKAQVMMLENVCYRRDVMAVLNMVRQGLFGELIHVQGGYQHDLREVKFNDGTHPYGHGVEFGEKGFSEAKWRTQHSVDRNGDLYPTHGIGPLAHCLNINRGNRFVRIGAFATKARGLHNHVVKQGGASHPNARVNFQLGDVVTTQLSCANGETILLQHDTNLPRPYSLGFRVQGTEGIWMDVNKSLYLEGKTAKAHQWEAAAPWLEKYDHPLWARWSKDTAGAGHGGMDFFVVHAFVEAAKAGAPTPMDVYDAAAWSAITPLSEESIRKGNQTLAFPDFTAGAWKTRTPIFALTDAY